MLSNCYDWLQRTDWNEHTARVELFYKEPLPPIYTCPEQERESLIKEGVIQRIVRIVKQLFSVICFPIYLSRKCRQIYSHYYQVGHALMGRALFPAYLKNRNQVLRLIESWNINTFIMRSCCFSLGVLPILSLTRPPVAAGLAGAVLDSALQQVGKRDGVVEKKWRPQRFTVAANGEKIDAIFVGRKAVEERALVEAPVVQKEEPLFVQKEEPLSRVVRFERWIFSKIVGHFWTETKMDDVVKKVEERLGEKIWAQTGMPQQVERVASRVEEVRKGRVLFYCCSQEELSEWMWCDENLLSLAEKTHSDLVVWNHPGLGSTGKLTKESALKTYAAMLQFLEDPKGFGASEIICCGPSVFGSAITLETLQNHVLKPSIRYVLLLNGACSTIQAAISSVSSLFGSAVRFFGWDMNNVEALAKIQAPALILQTARVDNYEPLIDSSKLIPDGVIEDVDATLAKALLDGGKLEAARKVVGIPRWHDEPLSSEHIDALARDVEGFLAVCNK